MTLFKITGYSALILIFAYSGFSWLQGNENTYAKINKSHNVSIGDNWEKEKNDKMDWWKDAKFGMFIHWGLYSQLAGEWKGEAMKGRSNAEQIDLIMKIPNAEYEKTANFFNPVQFNAREWVKIAKEAGMKYMVITAKHQDGFSMFKTSYSDYNIVDATPFAKDPIAELAKECRIAGIKFGIYYSQARDYHVAGANWNTHGNTWDFPPQTQEDFESYFYGKVFHQVKELLTNYGDISLMWFDVPYKTTNKMSRDLRSLVLSLRPQCIINSRIGNDEGDYVSLPDREIADKSVDFEWETCATMNDTWGYSKYDNNWKSVKTLVYQLVDVVSKGGNYLLNVGPTGEGLIPGPSIVRLKEMGSWINVNREAIFDTKTLNLTSQKDSIIYLMSNDGKKGMPLPSIGQEIPLHW